MICSKLAKSNLISNLISTINTIGHEIVKQIVEKEMIVNNMYLDDYLELYQRESIKTYKREILNIVIT